ncbi:MAG TPA: arylamine N-acetyltransferase [Solirubrobacteraceae bacterium]
MFDLDCYLSRIGLDGRPTLAEVHRAHATTIPFENLDPRIGRPVSLAPADIEHKLLTERRGGYCFEQNLLLKMALEALGAEVDMFLARVRYGVSPGVTRPRSHLLLRARSGGSSWHADVGFGLGTLLDPLPFGPGAPHDQAGWRFRIVADGPELVLQEDTEAGWTDLYGFPEQPVHGVDVETINWWTSTHPHSPFVTGLIVSSQTTAGTRTTLSDRAGLTLRERTPRESREREVTLADVPAILTATFGLEGFDLDEAGRLRRPA